MPAAAGPGSPAFLRPSARSCGDDDSMAVQPHAEVSPRVPPSSEPRLRPSEHGSEASGYGNFDAASWVAFRVRFSRLLVRFSRLLQKCPLVVEHNSEGKQAAPFLFSSSSRGGRRPQQTKKHPGLTQLGRQRHLSAPEHHFVPQQAQKTTAGTFDPGLSFTVCFVGEMWQNQSLSKTNTANQRGSQLRIANTKYQPGFETQVQNPLYKSSGVADAGEYGMEKTPLCDPSSLIITRESRPGGIVPFAKLNQHSCYV